MGGTLRGPLSISLATIQQQSLSSYSGDESDLCSPGSVVGGHRFVRAEGGKTHDVASDLAKTQASNEIKRGICVVVAVSCEENNSFPGSRALYVASVLAEEVRVHEKSAFSICSFYD